MSERYLPDVELLVAAVLNDVASSTTPPANLATKLPRRVIYKIAGTATHPKFLDAPHVQVTSYAASRQAAIDLAETARAMLFDAWRSQKRVVSKGGIHKVIEITSPFENRQGSVDGAFRVDATYQVFTRP